MKVNDRNGNEVEVGTIKPCPFCGGTNIKVTAKKSFDELVAEHGGACISFECDDCDSALYQHRIPDNKYYVGLGMLIAKWNDRKGA